jgi:hypothetical protein
MELDANWSDYGTPLSNTRSDTYSHGGTYSRFIVFTAQDYAAGIYQTLQNLTIGKKYRVSAWVRGNTLSGGQFRLLLGTEPAVFTKNVSNGNWVELRGTKVATATSLDVVIYIPASCGNSQKSYYIDDVSVTEIIDGDMSVNGDISSGGIITGNNLSPNFVPSLFGIHWNASASEFWYNGGVSGNMLTHIKWSSNGYPDVIQTIEYYSGTDQIHYVTTTDGNRTVTETLAWSVNNLTNYSISFS